MQLLTLSQCKTEIGISTTTLYRWIEKGKLHQLKDGRVRRSSVEKLKAARRTGRPHGLSALEKQYLVRDAEALAEPYLHESSGLDRFEAVGKIVFSRYAAMPRARLRAKEALARLYSLL